jgi:hypothetical protein
MAMISTARTKIKAEAGHPCLIHRKTLKGAETHLLFRIQEFGNLSGLKLNKNKTEGIWLGRLKHTKDKYENITWTNEPIKSLGVYFDLSIYCLCNIRLCRRFNSRHLFLEKEEHILWKR